MKANLPQREPEWLARWGQERLYERIQEAGQGRPLYVLHDGPPYANGRIHIGHALNKILERHHRQIENHVGLSGALRARMGLSRVADRASSHERTQARRKKTSIRWRSGGSAKNTQKSFTRFNGTNFNGSVYWANGNSRISRWPLITKRRFCVSSASSWSGAACIRV